MPSKPSSWIWFHDASNKRANRSFHVDKNGREVWKCRHCLDRKHPIITSYLRNGGTGTAAKHLKNKHRINKPSTTVEEDELVDSSQQVASELDSRPDSIIRAFQNTGDQLSRKRQRILKLEEVDTKHLIELFQNYIVDCSLSFRHCERSSFRSFISYINPFAEQLLPRSHATLSTNLIEKYNWTKGKIRAFLQTTISRIHISCDNWTCENAGKAYMGITARFVNKSGRQQLVLAIKELLGSHSGENMAEIFLKVAQDFDVVPLIGFCNADNASPNDIMTENIEEALKEQGLP